MYEQILFDTIENYHLTLQELCKYYVSGVINEDSYKRLRDYMFEEYEKRAMKNATYAYLKRGEL